MRGKRKKWIQQVLIGTIIIINSGLAFINFSSGDEDIVSSERNTEECCSPVNMTARTDQLSRVCDKYSLDSESPEYSSLHSLPTGPGVEVVLLPGTPPVTVCVPHKVGSHAWGVFSRQLAELYPARMSKLRAMNWRTRAGRTKRAVIVRHPLERLVSAYRMLFQVSHLRAYISHSQLFNQLESYEKVFIIKYCVMLLVFV